MLQAEVLYLQHLSLHYEAKFLNVLVVDHSSGMQVMVRLLLQCHRGGHDLHANFMFYNM